MAFVSKARKSASEKFNLENFYTPAEAIKNAKEVSNEKFDSTFRVAFNLNVDPRHADQMIRGSIVLPNGSGKVQKVLALVTDDKAEEAKKAGADFIGADDMIEKIQKNN
jgi:large subunit ribosomal protein L1